MKGMTFEKFEEIFNNLNDAEKIELWNDLCDDYFYFNAYGHVCSVDDFDEFVVNGRSDTEEIYEWLESYDRLQDFAEENDPDYNEEDWEDEEEEDEEE